MIAGGVASIVYGEPRLTQDLDIVASRQRTKLAAYLMLRTPNR
jgi:hypothetical protein